VSVSSAWASAKASTNRPVEATVTSVSAGNRNTARGSHANWGVLGAQVGKPGPGGAPVHAAQAVLVLSQRGSRRLRKLPFLDWESLRVAQECVRVRLSPAAIARSLQDMHSRTQPGTPADHNDHTTDKEWPASPLPTPLPAARRL